MSMQVFVEDWSAGYGSPYLVMADDSATTVGGPSWSKTVLIFARRASSGQRLPRSLSFDGVRRVEAVTDLDQTGPA
jgi:hypothetical protein